MIFRLAGLAACAALALAAAPVTATATATGGLSLSDVRIGTQPGFVRVVLDFGGGALELNRAQATDPSPADGRARVEFRQAGIRVPRTDRREHGVRARVDLAGAGRATIVLTGDAGRFKYVRISVLHGPERLVLDLYRSAPPTRAAEIRSGRGDCLTLTSVQHSGRGLRVRGTEKDLFEGSFVLRVRDAAGRVVGRRIVTARGAWDETVATPVSRAQAGTVEAVAASAKDGSLACLVQRRVMLAP